MTKKTNEMHVLEREQWLSEVLQKHQSSLMYSFVSIHSVRSETDKNLHSMHGGFYTKEVGGTRLVFSKKGDF